MLVPFRVAIEVPANSGVVLKTPTPGAAISTVDPKLLNVANRSSVVLAATAIMLSKS